MSTLLYPGTFDPITLGHENIICRSANLCDHLIIAVAIGHHKSPLFSLEERLAMVKDTVQHLKLPHQISVIAYDGLLSALCEQQQTYTLLRGIRSAADADYEIRLAAMNQHLNPKIETIFLATDKQYLHISSTMVREIAKLGGDTSGLVNENIKKILQDKLC